MSRRSGRLELTWTNKDMRLLSHGENTYEWVDRQDWRVSEVRLLNPVASVGDDDGSNLLIQGDALHALTALTALPELADRYVGKVKLCYIDPPFNTGETFAHYDDAGHPSGLEVPLPLAVAVWQINDALRELGSPPVDDSDLAPLRSL